MKEYNYGALLWKIMDKFGTQKEFCKRMGISTSTLSNYLSGRTAMPSDFIEDASNRLGIATEEIGFYFFNPIAEKTPRGKA